MAFLDLRTSRDDDQQRQSGRPIGEVLQEGHQALLGPMQVLHNDDRRSGGRERLEELPPGGEGLCLLSWGS